MEHTLELRLETAKVWDLNSGWNASWIFSGLNNSQKYMLSIELAEAFIKWLTNDALIISSPCIHPFGDYHFFAKWGRHNEVSQARYTHCESVLS